MSSQEATSACHGSQHPRSTFLDSGIRAPQPPDHACSFTPTSQHLKSATCCSPNPPEMLTAPRLCIGYSLHQECLSTCSASGEILLISQGQGTDGGREGANIFSLLPHDEGHAEGATALSESHCSPAPIAECVSWAHFTDGEH